jgi:hypothetical protein
MDTAIKIGGGLVALYLLTGLVIAIMVVVIIWKMFDSIPPTPPPPQLCDNPSSCCPYLRQ